MNLWKTCFTIFLLLFIPSVVLAEEQTVSGKKEDGEEPKSQILELADGKLQLPLPSDWQQVKPRSRIIAHEFHVPAAKKKSEKQVNAESAGQGSGKKDDGKETAELGRMTIMNAGGGVKANIARWVGQFRTEDGKPLDDPEKKVVEKKLGPLTIHTVDLAGTFLDKPRGPFGPSVEKPDYRMLAAIVPTKDSGMWFIKYYGPRELVDTQVENFQQMIEGIEYKGAMPIETKSKEVPKSQPIVVE